MLHVLHFPSFDIKPVSEYKSKFARINKWKQTPTNHKQSGNKSQQAMPTYKFKTTFSRHLNKRRKTIVLHYPLFLRRRRRSVLFLSLFYFRYVHRIANLAETKKKSERNKAQKASLVCFSVFVNLYLFLRRILAVFPVTIKHVNQI